MFIIVTAFCVVNYIHYYGLPWDYYESPWSVILWLNLGTLILLAVGLFLSRTTAGKVLILLGSTIRAIYPLLNLQRDPYFAIRIPSIVDCCGFILLAVVAVLAMVKGDRKWLFPVCFIPGAVIFVQMILYFIIYHISLIPLICQLGTTIGVVLGGLALAKPELTVSASTPKAKQPRSMQPIEELKKYKGLLDSGVISQEEYDEKKKQLLGL